MNTQRFLDWTTVRLVSLVLLIVAGIPKASADQPGYTFQKIATLATPCTPAPGGGFFQFDFEPWGINSRGDLAFAADFTNTNALPCGAGNPSDGEGVFLWRNGQLSQVTRNGLAAPGGGTFAGGVFAYTSINDPGDVAFVYGLDPLFPPELEGFPKAGLYRFSQTGHTFSSVVVPGVTPSPGFGLFQSTYQHATIDNSGDIVFPGLVRTAFGTAPGLGLGIFVAGKLGQISKVMAPGDPAPGGSVFDLAFNPWINDGGDVAFGAHVKGEECINIGSPVLCGESLYLRSSSTGVIESIAHQGDPAPGGGNFRWAWGAVLNNRGEIAFMGELGTFSGPRGIFLHSRGGNVAIARPGDPMPGGGKIQTVNPVQSVGNYFLNNRGEVSFNAALDTGESGLYVHSNGGLQLVARTGTKIPGVGTIASVAFVITGGTLNESGQVTFFATLDDGSGVLLVATPHL
jgi:hypothetical protein